MKAVANRYLFTRKYDLGHHHPSHLGLRILQLNASRQAAVWLLLDDIQVGCLVRVVFGTRDHAVLVGVH